MPCKNRQILSNYTNMDFNELLWNGLKRVYLRVIGNSYHLVLTTKRHFPRIGLSVNQIGRFGFLYYLLGVKHL